MKFEDENETEPETLSDLVLTTQEGDGVKAGIGVSSAQLTIQGQISDSRTANGLSGTDFQFQSDANNT